MKHAQVDQQATPFAMMAKPIGPRCNIDCKYCYYLEKEDLFPETKKFQMSPAVLESYVSQQIEAGNAAGMKEIPFAWQGGEPTMLGVDYFRRIVRLQKKYAQPGVTITNALQTNAILLDDEWAAFLRDQGFLVGVSIDGPKKLHDRYRVDRAGRPTFDRVMSGIDLLQRYDVPHNALTVVNRANSGRGKAVYKFLKGIGFEFIQFIPIAERSTGVRLAAAPQIDADPANAVTPWSVAPQAYGKFLCDVFDSWFARDIGKISVQFFDVHLGSWLGENPSLCVFSENCGDALVVEHDGSVYSCDHFVYPEFRLGNLNDEPLSSLVWSDRQREFGTDKYASLTQQCRSCDFRFACNGGCPKQRFSKSRDGEAGHNYFCESYTAFFRHAGARLEAMADCIRSGLPASAAASNPHPQRNTKNREARR